jgi:uncharacterized protein YjiS (DUF1127 family)
MQVQKPTQRHAQATQARQSNPIPSKYRATRPRSAMRGVQHGFAKAPVVLHMQHRYLALVRQRCLSIEQFVKETIMAAYETTRPAPFGAISIFRFVQFVSDIYLTVANWNDARVTRSALGKLSDRELDDIGLCRGDIEMIGR